MCLTQISGIVADYRAGVRSQPWKKVDGKRLKKIFEDYMLYGVVHDERGLRNISEKLGTLIRTMEANTILMGHTPMSPKLVIEEATEGLFNYDDRFEEWLCDYVTDPDQGSWRISDYAMDHLSELANSLCEDELTDEETIQVINKILMVVHRRNDLTELFVSGGVELLDDMAEK